MSGASQGIDGAWFVYAGQSRLHIVVTLADDPSPYTPSGRVQMTAEQPVRPTVCGLPRWWRAGLNDPRFTSKCQTCWSILA